MRGSFTRVASSAKKATTRRSVLDSMYLTWKTVLLTAVEAPAWVQIGAGVGAAAVGASAVYWAAGAGMDRWRRETDPIAYYAQPGEAPWKTMHRISTPSDEGEAT